MLLLLIYCNRTELSPEDQDELAIEAMVACQDELGRRLRLPMIALADWEPDMVSHLGGDRYRVDSYVDEVRGEEAVRRIHYTCSAVRIGEDEWRINTLETRP